jgi:hypothetical protein
MTSLVIYLVLAVYGIASFLGKRRHHFIVVLFVLISNGFGFINPKSTIIKSSDIALFMCFFLMLHHGLMFRGFFRIKGDPIAFCIVVLLGYYFIRMLVTVGTGAESFLDAVRVFRFDLFYLTYFLFRLITPEDLEKSFKPLFLLTSIAGVFYLLQFAGIQGILYGRGEGNLGTHIQRFRNAPLLSAPIFFVLMNLKTNVKWRIIFLFFFAALVVFPMSRGLIMTTFGVSFGAMVFKEGGRKLYRYLFVAAVVGVMSSQILLYRFSHGGNSVVEDINKAFKLGSYEEYLASGKGTFSFRIALALERLEYLSAERSRFLFGIGTIHEDTKSNKLRFKLGSYKAGSEAPIKQMIDTDDIAFVTHLVRYGFLYMILFSIFLCNVLLRFYKKRRFSAAFLGLLLITQIMLGCLGTDQFSTFQQMALLLILIALFANKKEIPVVLKATGL